MSTRALIEKNLSTSSRRDRGPHPGLLALASFVLMVAGLVIAAAMSGGQALTSPFASTAEVADRVRSHHDAFRVAAFFQLGSAVPLAIYTATVYARQLRLGVRVPGPVIGLSGWHDRGGLPVHLGVRHLRGEPTGARQ